MSASDALRNILSMLLSLYPASPDFGRTCTSTVALCARRGSFTVDREFTRERIVTQSDQRKEYKSTNRQRHRRRPCVRSRAHGHLIRSADGCKAHRSADGGIDVNREFAASAWSSHISRWIQEYQTRETRASFVLIPVNLLLVHLDVCRPVYSHQDGSLGIGCESKLAIGSSRGDVEDHKHMRQDDASPKDHNSGMRETIQRRYAHFLVRIGTIRLVC